MIEDDNRIFTRTNNNLYLVFIIVDAFFGYWFCCNV